MKTVKVADGISETEARTIAECYFHKNVGCGAFLGIHDDEDRWMVDGVFGYAGAPIRGFYIAKQSGKVVSPVGPSYDNPLDIFP